MKRTTRPTAKPNVQWSLPFCLPSPWSPIGFANAVVEDSAWNGLERESEFGKGKTPRGYARIERIDFHQIDVRIGEVLHTQRNEPQPSRESHVQHRVGYPCIVI